jgi:hypothetical protein
VCHGCAAIEEAEKMRRKDPPPGLRHYTRLPDDFDLEQAREDRAEAMAAELASTRQKT